MGFLSQIDPEISCTLDIEGERQRETINLIASENYTSQAVSQLCHRFPVLGIDD